MLYRLCLRARRRHRRQWWVDLEGKSTHISERLDAGKAVPVTLLQPCNDNSFGHQKSPIYYHFSLSILSTAFFSIHYSWTYLRSITLPESPDLTSTAQPSSRHSMASLTPAQALALLEDTSLSDYTIKCDDHVFPVHKAILCHKSEFFAACIKNVHFEVFLQPLFVK